mgnify:CR=1 FL=1
MQDLDAIDRRLVAALRADGRAPVARLAQQLQLSRATVEKRIARMVDGGTILGFTVRARDHGGAGVRAVMLIEVAGRSTSAVIRSLKTLPELEALHTTNGGWDLIADIYTASLADFDRLLREVRSIDGVLGRRLISSEPQPH